MSHSLWWDVLMLKLLLQSIFSWWEGTQCLPSLLFLVFQPRWVAEVPCKNRTTYWRNKKIYISKGIRKQMIVLLFMDKATNLKVFPIIQCSTPVMKSSFVLILKWRDYDIYYDIQKRNKWYWDWNPLGKLLNIIMSCTLKLKSALLTLRNLEFIFPVVWLVVASSCLPSCISSLWSPNEVSAIPKPTRLKLLRLTRRWKPQF